MNNSPKISKSVEDLRDFVQQIKEYSKYHIREIKLSSQEAWSILDGVLSHKSRGFFQVTGLEKDDDPQIQQLILFQPQSALTGLIFHQLESEIFILLQARVEPGNTGIIQFGPTIQSTPANYLKLHGGKATSYISYFTSFMPGANLITHSMQHDLGRRYYQKSKTHHYIEVDSFLETDENMIWASLKDIVALCHEDNLLNADFRSLLSVFNWDRLLQDGSSNRNEEPPLLFPSIQPEKHHLISLDKLRNWSLDENGIYPHGSEHDFVKMFEFECTNREVTKWSQPLFCVKGVALAQLVMKEEKNEHFFLLTLKNEPGISTDYAFYPSYLANPEEEQKTLENCQLVSEMIQCDEGGRFYQNDCLYQILKPEKDFVKKDSQFWVSRAQFKDLLASSNTCSFQLRCISSMILPILNPNLSKEF